MIKIRSQNNFYKLANFHYSPFVLDNFEWNNVEQYYQAQKFIHEPKYMNFIKECNSPFKAIALGRLEKIDNDLLVYRVRYPLNIDIPLSIIKIIDNFRDDVKIRKDWKKVRVDVMNTALHAKFYQNPKIRTLLLSTDNLVLLEENHGNFWGDDINMLGQLLMKIRRELRK